MTDLASKYTRQPKHYIRLPSQSAWYESGNLELTHTGELPIRAMTARDEQVLKNPEALLNGDAIARVVRSCCPEIKMDPMDLISADMEVILLAIMSASYNRTMDFDTECPKCKKENRFEANISRLLDTVRFMNREPVFVENIYTLDNGTTETLKFFLSPLRYQQITRKSLMELEQSKLMMLLKNDTISEDDKLHRYSEIFERMVSENFYSVVECVEYIETPLNGNIEDRKTIEMIFAELDRNKVDECVEKISQMSDSCIDTTYQAVCQSCGHEWTTQVEMDASRFFAKA
jgi:hypothetical protein